MTDLPAFMQPHTVLVATRTGTTGAGPTTADPVILACRREAKVRLVRNQHAAEVVSSTTLFTSDRRPLWTPGSVVTWDGGRGTVITAAAHDDGGMGGWQHTEIALT